MKERECLRSLIDWFQFSLPTTDLNAAYDLLGIDESQWNDLSSYMNFYSKQKVCGDIKILYEGTTTNTMGINILMPGQACRQYETYHDAYDWETLMHRVVEADGHFTRLDLAIDEIRYNGEKPYFTLRQILRRLARGECRSKFKKDKEIRERDISTGKALGETIYFGSPHSEIKVRMYEKNFERLNADKELEEHLTTWNRVEIQLNKKRAQMAVFAILSGIPTGEATFGVLRHYIMFVDKQTDTNKSRWPMSKFWEDYLGNIKRLPLTLVAPDKTIDQKASWIDKQVKPTLAEVWYALGSPGHEMFAEILQQGMERMTDAQWVRAEEYRVRLQAEKQKLDSKKRAAFSEQEEVRQAENLQRMAQIEYDDWEKEQQKKPIALGSLVDPRE